MSCPERHRPRDRRRGVGFGSLAKQGTTLRDDVLVKARACDGIVLGTQSHADYPRPDKGGRNISAGFRVGLDLYANVRPARTRPFLPSNMRPDKRMDLVIMSEATEGFYPDRNMAQGWGEMMPSPDMALSVRDAAVDEVLADPRREPRISAGLSEHERSPSALPT